MQSSSGDLAATTTLEAPSAIGAMEETIYAYGEDYWVLAVYPIGEPTQRWRLIRAEYWQGNPEDSYLSLEEAIKNNQQDGEILIAIPDER